MRPTPVLLALALALALAGCGDENETPAVESQPTATTTPTGQECQPPAGAGLSPRRSASAGETVFLTDVSASTDRCADRVLFDFKGSAEPGYEVSYQPASVAKVEDASGKQLAIQGSAFLVVRLTPAMTAEIKGEEVIPTYTGPRNIVPQGFTHVQEIAKTGDFESVVTWAIGLDEKRPFTATASSGRLVIEIS